MPFRTSEEQAGVWSQNVYGSGNLGGWGCNAYPNAASPFQSPPGPQGPALQQEQGGSVGSQAPTPRPAVAPDAQAPEPSAFAQARQRRPQTPFHYPRERGGQPARDGPRGPSRPRSRLTSGASTSLGPGDWTPPTSADAPRERTAKAQGKGAKGGGPRPRSRSHRADRATKGGKGKGGK